MAPARSLGAGIALLALILQCSAKPVTLVDSAGKLAPNRELISLAARTGERSTVVASVGGKGSRKNSLLNNAFGTAFEAVDTFATGDSSSSATVDGAQGVIVVNCDGVTTDGEAKLAALSAAVADVVVVNVYRSDLGRNVAANVRAFKSVFAQRLAAEKEAKEGTAEPLPLIVVVHDCEPDVDADAIKEAVEAEAQAAWDELGGPATPLSAHVALSVAAVPHPRYAPDAYAAAAAAVRAACAADAGSTTASFAPRLGTAWTATRVAPPPPPARSELAAAYAAESAGAEAAADAEGALGAWRAAVARGRVVGGFGGRARALRARVLEAYDRATLSHGGSPLRAQRRAELVALVDGGVERLFRQQVALLSADALRAFKREMVALLNKDKLTEESEAALLRSTLFDFESRASELLSDDLPDLTFEAEYEELEADLCDYGERFGDSPAAQTRALAKMEKQVSKAARDGDKPGKKGKEGKRSIVAGLNLVGMVRTGGLGNLQAFSGYRLGPHTVTLGYANDADTPEAMQDGEAPPLLRLQPKLNLDIDL